ncbi:DUF6903 family protein [Neobacillus kokaensis]|uniref:Uncharacterized protein n=1 Tax=Neobacillus kokaensis TaxID=2759023 RepID=A0ABQ3NAP9_9BACI|nr:hypothetical protein [Neobacillus kokaensis]GHH99941.1 hypothetical protein AM1BK_34840 [Neobacillus kokaensis]
MKASLIIMIKLIVLVLSLALIFIGQKAVGKMELGMMLIGLAGLLGLLYDYNRKYV